MREILRVASSLKPKLGSCLRHRSPRGLPLKGRFLSFDATHTEQPVIRPSSIKAFCALECVESSSAVDFSTVGSFPTGGKGSMFFICTVFFLCSSASWKNCSRFNSVWERLFGYEEITVIIFSAAESVTSCWFNIPHPYVFPHSETRISLTSPKIGILSPLAKIWQNLSGMR